MVKATLPLTRASISAPTASAAYDPYSRSSCDEAPSNAVRALCRIKLTEVLAYVVTTAPSPDSKDDANSKPKDVTTEKSSDSKYTKLATKIEEEMFSKLPDKKYKEKYRSLLFNLKDPKNPKLKERVVKGEITVDELVSMTAEELASDELKKERESVQQWFKEAALLVRESDRIVNVGLFVCGRCKSDRTWYYQLQTRSADEPMTTFVQCCECNNKWRC